jgi:SAM-dependent methyltransferase
MSLYRSLRSTYHLFVPSSLRHAIYQRSPAPIASLRRRLVLGLEERAPHDDVYDNTYYETFVEPTTAASAPTMAVSIVRELAPKSVVDLGCGTGALLAALAAAGVPGRGLEYAKAAIGIARARGITVDQYDIEHDPIPGSKADVAISTEVAEHLPESCADRFVEALVTIAQRAIVLTAAVPSGGGTDHVNEQPNEYWIAKLARKGAELDADLTQRWRAEWTAAGVAHCFASAVMVFRFSGTCSHT